MNKKNILVAAPYSLIPADSGGRIHVLSSLEPISDRVNLHLLAFLNPSEWVTFNANRASLTAQYYRIFRSIHFLPRPILPSEMQSKIGKILHFATHTFYGLPLMDVSFYNRAFINLAGELIDRYNIDLIEAHQLHMAFVKRFFPKLPVILVEQNWEHEVWPFWTHSGSGMGNRLWNQFGKISRRFAYQIEVENKWKIDGTCFISLKEMKQADFASGKIFWLPPGIPSNPGEKKFSRGRLKVLWVGGFDWYPNAEGAIWFANECWPLLKEKAKDLEFHFVGSNPPSELAALHDGQTVFVPGFVADLDEAWRTSDVFIVPIRSGGGIRIKILEALNAGIPVVTTSKGCEGIPYEPGIDLLIADDARGFVGSILRLAEDLELRQALSQNGKKLIQQHFSLSQIGERKMGIYQAVLSRE